MYYESAYELEKVAANIARERWAEADAWRLAHELEARPHQPLRTRLARTLTHTALRLDRRAARAQLDIELQAESTPRLG